jgi:hypothetical protein
VEGLYTTNTSTGKGVKISDVLEKKITLLPDVLEKKITKTSVWRRPAKTSVWRRPAKSSV